MNNISKYFPGVKALDKVDLKVRRGTVHALMGENGAGKSTLMKCLFGIYSKDSGTIKLDGNEIDFKNSKEALEKCGINMKNIESYKDSKNILAHSDLENLIKKEINTHIVNKPNLRVFEKVKQFALLDESFSVENGLMSATQKVKRNKVFEKYEEVIGNMYNK